MLKSMRFHLDSPFFGICGLSARVAVDSVGELHVNASSWEGEIITISGGGVAERAIHFTEDVKRCLSEPVSNE